MHVNNRGRITWMRANPSLDRFIFFFIRVLRARVDVCMDRKNNLLTLKALDLYPKNKKNKKKKKRKAFYPTIDSHVPGNPSVCVHEEAKR